nr:hypothetical protein [Tanacetum cinerariifolium]
MESVMKANIFNMKKMKSGMKAGIFNMKKMKSGMKATTYHAINQNLKQTVQVFNSRQDLIDSVKETVLSFGYVIVIKRSKANEHVSFHCDVSDREFALMKAYDTAFPNAKGIAWNTLVNSHNEEAYQLNLEQLQEIVFDFPGVMVYLNKYWLTQYKERFVAAWTDKFPYFGNQTTNRVESQHAKLKLYLDSAQSDLLTAVFWRKLNLSPCASLGDDDLGCQVKVEVENFNTEFKKQSRAGKKSLLRKMKEITTPSETSLNEPTTQKATGGRSSFKRAPADQPSQTQEPAGYNFSSMPTFVGKYNFMNQKQRRHAYIDQFPNMLHPYIEEVEM